ncbi:MAG: hypothetical protein A2Y62_02475 [Candidatus Fischerbacteria bacterium RBG_13_37_8]|uniref:PilZ domain-containing protein n=1 Tax=Candidatus Fischerbacteria bacterium RBG_13_37_8 TaxID=1817863 RepID=A0A1F5VJE5_9BACT|nr:MAG: hypothetical protein A2Y62_02475 [Candidatus Fischerbacteria bacterium RBG_13_37_8]
MVMFSNPIMRKSTRVPLKLKVILQRDNKEIESYTHDISVDGMFVQSVEKIQINTLINCSLFLPEQQEPLSILSRVMYDGIFSYTGKESFYGIGLNFMEITDESRKILKTYLDKQFYQCKNYRIPRKLNQSTDNGNS